MSAFRDVRKGPGDLPGDSSNPNSPDYVEPTFDMGDAAYSVAQGMLKRNRVGQTDVSEVAELVGDVSENAAALAWILENVSLPGSYRDTISWLAGRAEKMDKAVADRFDLLNRGDAA